MKRQTLTLILKDSSATRRMLLSVGMISTVINGAFSLSVNAQSYHQDSFLPPEVIPVNQAITYNSKSENSNTVVSNAQNTASIQNAPGIQDYQTPQEARQALYHSLMGTNTYPQFSGQSFNQNNNLTSNMNANQTFNQGTPQSTMPQNMPQTWTTQMSPQSNISLSQNNNLSNIAPAQTQILSGNVATQATSQQRTTGGISHLTGVATGTGMNIYALSNITSPGGLYSAGLLGAGTLNYGANNGFRF